MMSSRSQQPMLSLTPKVYLVCMLGPTAVMLHYASLCAFSPSSEDDPQRVCGDRDEATEVG